MGCPVELQLTTREPIPFQPHISNLILYDRYLITGLNHKENRADLYVSYSTPSLLRPIDAPLKCLYLEMRVTPFTPSVELPGALSSLRSFTYQPIDNHTKPGEGEHREIDLAPIKTFLASNCPNLQHLSIRIRSSGCRNTNIIVHYCKFVEILAAKPNLETPKTFTAIDIHDMYDSLGRERARTHEYGFGREIYGWRHIGPGQYQSIVSHSSQ